MQSSVKSNLAAKKIAELMSGNSIVEICVKNQKIFNNCEDLQKELPKNVIGVGCHGRFVFIILDGGDSSIQINDGSIGSWSSIDRKGSAATLSLSNGTKVVYQGPTKAGVLKWSRGRKPLKKRLLSLGLDILSNQFSEENFIEHLNKKQKDTLAKSLLDSSVISEVDNLSCSEILWRSKLSPHRKIDSLCLEEFQLLYKSTLDLLHEVKINPNMFDKVQVKKLKKDPIGNTINLEYFGKKIIWWSPNIQI